MKSLFLKWFALLGLLLFLGVAVAPNVNADGLPDLIISRIDPHTGDVPIADGIEVRIKNIGDSPISGEITIRLNVRRMFLGIIPLGLEFTKLGSVNVNNLNPGGWAYEDFWHIPEERFRFYKVTATVDATYNITESNELNNVYIQRYFITNPENAIIGWWEL